MYKNGGILLRKKSIAPIGVDPDSIIIFYDENNVLSYVDSYGKIHTIDIENVHSLIDKLKENTIKLDEENVIKTNTSFTKDVYISGNLLVDGHTYEIVGKHELCDKNFVEVNSLYPISNAGLQVNRSQSSTGLSGAPALIFWNEVNKKWYINNSNTSDEIIGKKLINSMIESASDNIVSSNTFFGDGSDGDLVLSDEMILDRDYFFNNIQLNQNGNIKTNGFRLFSKNNLIFNGGIITNSGNNGNVSNIYFSGCSGGNVTNLGSLGNGSPGGKGSNGTPNGGKNTISTISSPINNGGSGGFGGNGGDGIKGKGGTSSNDIKPKNHIMRNVYLALQASRGIHLIGGGLGGDGGASGGGDGVNNGAGGGGGGSGGGVIQIIAKKIVATNNVVYPSIICNGGNGSNGNNATIGDCGGGGGGSAGGGGFVQIFNLILIGPIKENLINALSGIPGNGGKGIGKGKDGMSGAKGKDGLIEWVNVKTSDWSIFTGFSRSINKIKG